MRSGRSAVSARGSRLQSKAQPRSDLEHLRLENQTKIIPVSAKRRDLIQSTRIKKNKEIVEWLENEHPNGLQILERLTKCPTEYAQQIKRALSEFQVLEAKAQRIFEQDVAEHTARQEETEQGINELENRIKELNDENQKLKTEIEHQREYGESLRRDAARLRSIMTAVQPEPEPKNDEFVDDKTAPLELRVQLYTIERERLEKTFDELQSRLMELTHEQTQLLSRKTE